MADEKALMTIINALTPLNPEERHRAVSAALVFLGETPTLVGANGGAQPSDTSTSADGDGDDYPANAKKWMRENSISSEIVDRAFLFQPDGFDIHGVPGTSKREMTLNTYILTGLGTYLSKNERTFADSVARAFCEKIGCYDPPNHAKYIKEKGSELSGDKKKGYTLTNPGIKRGAELVRELGHA